MTKLNPNSSSTNLEGVYAYLKRFSLSDALLIISLVNNAFKYGIHQLSDDTNMNVKAWISDLTKNHIDRFRVMANMTRMARFLILSKSNDHKSVILDTGTREIETAMSLVANLYDSDVEIQPENLEDMTVIAGRISQWQLPLHAKRDDMLGRGYLLFNQIPNSYKAEYDFDQKMKDYFGLGVTEFIISGFATWIMSTGVFKHKLTIEIPALAKIINSDTLDKFVKLSSGTPKDYKTFIRGENWKEPKKLNDIHGLDPFLIMPAVRVEKSGKLEPGQYVVPQPVYLLMRASLGVYYLLSDKEREIGASEGKVGKNNFKEIFGKVYREYIGKQLNQKGIVVDFIDIDEEIETTSRKPDFALIKDNVCVLLEVKTSFLTLEPRTFFDKDLARNELSLPKGNFKKALDQLNEFEEAIKGGKINDQRFRDVTKIVKIIVGFEDLFFANAFILPLAKEIYGNETVGVQIATLSDIEILGAKLSHGADILNKLFEKTNDHHLNKWSLGEFILKTTPEISSSNPILEESFKNLLSSVGYDGDIGDDFLTETESVNNENVSQNEEKE